MDRVQHWDNIFENSETQALGWYEDLPQPTITMIQKAALQKEQKILIAGAGATHLVKWLIESGYEQIIINDISGTALRKLRKQYEAFESIRWIRDDLTRSKKIRYVKDVAFWLDRAVFHFFTEEEERENYLQLIQSVLSPGGYLMIATFSTNCVSVCSGLPVVRYTVDSISEHFGAGFSLINSFEYCHRTPSGDARPYIYTLFQKANA